VAPPFTRGVYSPRHFHYTATDTTMGTLFLYAGVFALVTLAVAGVCEWFVRQEAKKSHRR
jgi:hypothetical protein